MKDKILIVEMLNEEETKEVKIKPDVVVTKDIFCNPALLHIVE